MHGEDPEGNGGLQRGIVGGTRRTCADPSSEVEIATPGPRQQHPIQLTIQHYRMSFSDVCQLFEELASLSVNQAVKRENVVRRWFRQHESNFPGRGPAVLALMSCLFPEKRPERVYGFRERRLEAVIVKTLGLGRSRTAELHQLQEQQGLDFASAVQQVMAPTDETSTPGGHLSVEEIEKTFDRVASTCPFYP